MNPLSLNVQVCLSPDTIRKILEQQQQQNNPGLLKKNHIYLCCLHLPFT